MIQTGVPTGKECANRFVQPPECHIIREAVLSLQLRNIYKIYIVLIQMTEANFLLMFQPPSIDKKEGYYDALYLHFQNEPPEP